jgi:ElaB/YqjD/DUF883 family membrane-anchored ribosome-binding protein
MMARYAGRTGMKARMLALALRLEACGSRGGTSIHDTCLSVDADPAYHLSDFQRLSTREAAMVQEVTVDKLLEDLQTVVRDADALLRATSAQTGEKIQEIRGRAEQSLKQARVRLAEVEELALERAKQAAGAADEYVRENPWQSIGIAAGVGLLLGLLVSRR